MAGQDTISCQKKHHPTVARCGIFQVEGIDPGYNLQYGFTHRHRLVIQRESKQAHELTLTAHLELRAVMIDQFWQFRGIKAVETFQLLQLHLKLADLLALLSLLHLSFVLGLRLLPASEQVTCTLQLLFLPLARLVQALLAVTGELLKRVTAI